MCRHTYCAARLQSLDDGATVGVYTVAKEMGHGGEAMVRCVYGHLGEVRHRAEVVEYRVEQRAAKLRRPLAAEQEAGRLAFGFSLGTTVDTTEQASQPYLATRWRLVILEVTRA